MSIAVRAKIIGMDPLIRKLRVLPQAARDQLRIAMAAEADNIVGLMTRLAPDDKDLRDSIGWAWGDKVPKGRMAIATKGKGDLSITIYAGSNEAFYARWWEFGTRERQQKSGKSTGAMPAHPFFYPGWRAGRKGAKAGIRKAARAAARTVAAS